MELEKDLPPGERLLGLVPSVPQTLSGVGIVAEDVPPHFDNV
jgi:hypothetical protein